MSYILPVLVTIFVWWFSTGVVLLLDRLPQRTHIPNLLITALLALASVYALIMTRSVATPLAVYEAFVAAILIWGWLELAFLLGVITGPRREPCPNGVSSAKRFWLALQVLAYHEIAILCALILVAIICWDTPNQTGLWTFSTLFAMRLSAKLNIFLGVPHMNEDFLPKRLDFLKSYFAQRSMNWFFPVSITVSMLVGAYVFHAAFSLGAADYEIAVYMLTGTLILLGTLEHWLLILRVPDSELWRWAMRQNEIDHKDQRKDTIEYKNREEKKIEVAHQT